MTADNPRTVADGDSGEAAVTRQVVTVMLGGQQCGIDVHRVEDVLGPQRTTRVPLAPPDVAGLMNLRGRIVTAIDLRRRLGLAERADGAPGTSVVVAHAGEHYGLVVDSVGDVVCVPGTALSGNPATLPPLWQRFSEGVARLEDGPMVVLDVARLLDFGGQAAA